MKELIKLFFTFFKIGITTFGGGYAMLPILEREIIEKQNLSTKEELTNYYAISQCTPGIISVNVATFIGYKRKGIAGGIVATIGIIFPSILIILLIANLISTFANLKVLQHVFSGIKVCVAALIISAVIKLWKNSVVDILSFFIFLILFILALIFNISPIIVVIVAGAIGGILKKEEVKW